MFCDVFCPSYCFCSLQMPQKLQASEGLNRVMAFTATGWNASHFTANG